MRPIKIVCFLLSLISILPVDASTYSGSLPVIFINTENNQPITSKETYLKATYYLDPMNTDGVEAIGSKESPLSLQIKGRGNYTWTGFDKKPYRLKLDAKTALLGMKKSKHFALLAHADDNLAFLRNTVGFELSRKLNLDWTPEAQPIEVVLNDEYIGLYFLTEVIKVDSNRVNITEQADNTVNTDEDPLAITGGWLVEIDNYDTDPHVEITEGNGQKIIFTYKSPETLSSQQEEYLRAQMSAINDAIYNEDKTSTEWENYIDIESLAKFYIVQELLDDCESFHGSCYLYRDKGTDAKWKFGPVWDFGNTFQRGSDKKFIYVEPAFNQTWIGEIAKFPAFQNKVKELWKEFCKNQITSIGDYIHDFTVQIYDAAKADKQRWPQYGNSDLDEKYNYFLSLLNNSAQWLGNQWDYVPEVIAPTRVVIPFVDIYLRGTFNNWKIKENAMFTHNGDGIYTLTNFDIPANSEFKIASSDWNTVDFGNNGTQFTYNQEYELEYKGGNISVKDAINNATIKLDYINATLLITDILGATPAIEMGNSYTINGLNISSDKNIAIYDIYGSKIAEGKGLLTLPTSGIYIIKNGTQTDKIIVR
jgi:hypothetical protein